MTNPVVRAADARDAARSALDCGYAPSNGESERDGDAECLVNEAVFFKS